MIENIKNKLGINGLLKRIARLEKVVTESNLATLHSPIFGGYEYAAYNIQDIDKLHLTVCKCELEKEYPLHTFEFGYYTSMKNGCPETITDRVKAYRFEFKQEKYNYTLYCYDEFDCQSSPCHIFHNVLWIKKLHGAEEADD